MEQSDLQLARELSDAVDSSIRRKLGPHPNPRRLKLTEIELSNDISTEIFETIFNMSEATFAAFAKILMRLHGWQFIRVQRIQRKLRLYLGLCFDKPSEMDELRKILDSTNERIHFAFAHSNLPLEEGYDSDTENLSADIVEEIKSHLVSGRYRRITPTRIAIQCDGLLQNIKTMKQETFRRMAGMFLYDLNRPWQFFVLSDDGNELILELGFRKPDALVEFLQSQRNPMPIGNTPRGRTGLVLPPISLDQLAAV